MTRFVVDVGAALEIVRAPVVVADGHALLAPTLWRSQVLSTLHEQVARGELPDDAARAQLAAVARLPVRLLGDGVLRRTAWSVADELGWAQTYAAEYVALTRLQADALVTTDAELAAQLAGVVDTVTPDALR